MMSHRSLLINPSPKPTGVLEHCRVGETNCWFSIFRGVSFQPHPLRRLRMLMHIPLFIIFWVALAVKKTYNITFPLLLSTRKILLPFRSLLFCLQIVQEAPSFIPCDYVVKESVVFIKPYRRGHRKCSIVFLFVRALPFQVRNAGKLGASLAHHEEYSGNILQNFQPLMQIVHAAIPVNYTREFRKLFEATKHSFYSNHAKKKVK